ncbi:MAG: proteasome accessory factor PafA2 family protein, partial [Acidimicrobiia bacterium]
MAVPKVCGIETEYGVVLRGASDANPVLASSMLINAYVEHRKVGWDFEDESPGRDARGFAREGAAPPEIETHLVNTVLTNGARYYVDHAHPEYSTPECADALELVCADKAGERILARSMQASRRLLGSGQEIVVYKNNTDGKGNSYGTHENYLVDRAVPFATLVRNLLPWFVSRQVFTGAGKVGSENGAGAVDYQLSQRADFFEEEVGLETTLKRPIVNTRDEPHADPQAYRRLHVIAGDANLCEVATFLKVGTTAIVLAMIEDGFIEKDLSIIGPVASMRTVSHDPTCRATVELLDGGRITAIELQWEFLRLAQKYADDVGLEALGGDEVG